MEIILNPAVIFRIYITSNPNIMTKHLPILVLVAIALGLSVNGTYGRGYESAQPFCAGSKFQTTRYNQVMLTNTSRTAVATMPLPVAEVQHQLNYFSSKALL